MEIEIVRYPTDADWLLVRNNALFTQRKHSDKVPSSSLKKKFIASEHSPIRDALVTANFYDIPSWITVHFVRHHEGFTPYISSQRNDIQFEYDRRKAPQDTLINMRFTGNFQALINISRKRLCLRASAETTKVWKDFLKELQKVSPEIVEFCVPECVYRNGICPEIFKSCGYNKTKKFDNSAEEYRENFIV